MKRRVLLAEDDRTVQRLMQLVLTHEGCSVVAAHNGAEAIATLEQGEAFDLVLSDYRMPARDGLAVLRAARFFLPCARLALMSAGQVDPETQRAVLDLGACTLVKPLLQEDLGSLLGGPPLVRRIAARPSRRRSERVPVDCATLVDVSDTGVGLELDTPVAPGTVLSISARVPTLPDTITADVVVRWSDGGRAGAEFVAAPAGFASKIQQLRWRLWTTESRT